MIYTHVDEDPFYNYKVYSLNNNMVERELSTAAIQILPYEEIIAKYKQAGQMDYMEFFCPDLY